MPRDGRIIDIRYYDAHFGHLRDSAFQSLTFAEWVGDRICRKLREYEFRLGKQDHVYFYLSSEPPLGETSVGEPRDFYRPVSCRLDPTTLDGLSLAEKEDALAELTLGGLATICGADNERLELIRQVRSDLAAKRRQLGVVYLSKETRRYKLSVVHYLTPLKQGPLTPLRPKHTYYAMLVFEDKTNDFRGTTKLFDFDEYDELHGAVGSVTLTGDVINIKPRRGYNYGTEIAVSRSALSPLAEPA